MTRKRRPRTFFTQAEYHEACRLRATGALYKVIAEQLNHAFHHGQAIRTDKTIERVLKRGNPTFKEALKQKQKPSTPKKTRYIAPSVSLENTLCFEDDPRAMCKATLYQRPTLPRDFTYGCSAAACVAFV